MARKKLRSPPTEAEIHAAADVIAARLRELLPNGLELRVDKSSSMARLWIRNPDLPEFRFPFMDLDNEGVDLGWPEKCFRRIARGVGNVARLVEVATPAVKAFIDYILVPDEDDAPPAANATNAEPSAPDGIPLHEEVVRIQIASCGGRDRGLTRVTIDIPDAQMPAIAGELAALLRSLIDLVAPQDASPGRSEIEDQHGHL